LGFWSSVMVERSEYAQPIRRVYPLWMQDQGGRDMTQAVSDARLDQLIEWHGTIKAAGALNLTGDTIAALRELKASRVALREALERIDNVGEDECSRIASAALSEHKGTPRG
jgi:predicted phosphatase